MTVQAIAITLAVMLAAFAPAIRADGPDVLPRVASINLCADQLLIDLAAPTQITSLTHLAVAPAASHFHRRAAAWPSNDGSAETVLADRPALVIAGEFGAGYTERLLLRAGIRVERLPLAHSIEEVFANIARVGSWIGRTQQASERVARLRQRLAAVRVDPTPDAPLAAIFEPNGYTVGRGSLRGEQLVFAGLRNAATLVGVENYGRLALESMVALHPDVLIDSPYSTDTFSRGQQLARHPALLARGVQPAIVSIPSRDTICGGPWSIEVVAQLAKARAAIVGEAAIR